MFIPYHLIYMMPREKLERRGLQALTDTDLVSVILGVGAKGKGVVKLAGEVARWLGRKFEDLENFNEESGGSKWYRRVNYGEMSGISGVGKVKAMKVFCAIELGRRLFAEDTEKVIIRSSDDVVREMHYLKKLKQEHVVALLLDARNFLIKKVEVAVGSLNKAVVLPRDIFYKAIKNNSSKIILVHNHPSGDVRPSKEDIEFAKKLKKAGRLIGIEVLDQVVV
jgi:DNA repair protein RadC